MPKGRKARDFEPPAVAHCDFCGRPFGPVKWNQRTCVACAVRGAPDQSKGKWGDYERDLAAYQLAQGSERGLRRAKAASNLRAVGRIKFAVAPIAPAHEVGHAEPAHGQKVPLGDEA